MLKFLKGTQEYGNCWSNSISNSKSTSTAGRLHWRATTAFGCRWKRHCSRLHRWWGAWGTCRWSCIGITCSCWRVGVHKECRARGVKNQDVHGCLADAAVAGCASVAATVTWTFIWSTLAICWADYESLCCNAYWQSTACKLECPQAGSSTQSWIHGPGPPASVAQSESVALGWLGVRLSLRFRLQLAPWLTTWATNHCQIQTPGQAASVQASGSVAGV